MLVLSRKPGQTLFIGDDVRIDFISLDGFQMRIAIDAPREIIILRGELVDARGRRREDRD